MLTIIVLIIVVLLIVVGSTKFNLHPFLGLLGAAIVMGFFSGLDEAVIITKMTEGFGSTLKSIGIIIAFGTIIGIFLEKSGAAKTMAATVLKIVGEKNSALAMNITGYIVSIPVFCDSGFVILSTLNKALSKKTGISMTVFAVALSTGLYATHVFVPPTPGPLAAAAAIGANIGIVLLLGLIVAIPTSLAGFFWAKFYAKRINIIPDDNITDKEGVLPGKVQSFAPIIIPIILIALNSVAVYPTAPFGTGVVKSLIGFVGDPVVALLIGVILSFTIKVKKKESQMNLVSEGLKQAGVIILITGAGGAFGNVLRATDISTTFGSFAQTWHIGLLLPFIIAALLKSAQGSSTVSIITTAALTAPLLASMNLDSEMAKALVVLAIGAGAMTVSHVNDSYFWVVSQFSGMDTKTALKTHTTATLFQGLVGIAVILILSLVLA